MAPSPPSPPSPPAPLPTISYSTQVVLQYIDALPTTKRVHLGMPRLWCTTARGCAATPPKPWRRSAASCTAQRCWYVHAVTSTPFNAPFYRMLRAALPLTPLTPLPPCEYRSVRPTFATPQRSPSFGVPVPPGKKRRKARDVPETARNPRTDYCAAARVQEWPTT